MTAVLNVYEAFSEYVNASNRAEWAGRNPSAWAIVGYVEKQRFMSEANNGGAS